MDHKATNLQISSCTGKNIIITYNILTYYDNLQPLLIKYSALFFNTVP
jgi:hypothetical protein